MFQVYNTFLNFFNIYFSFFSSGIIISSAGCCFPILLSFDLVTASAVLFPKNSPALWTIFLEAVFKESSPLSNICFSYFLVNYKNPHHLTHFLVLGSIDYLLNYIRLKLLQLLQVLEHFICFLFCLLIFLWCQIILLFKSFAVLAYVHLSFKALSYY